MNYFSKIKVFQDLRYLIVLGIVFFGFFFRTSEDFTFISPGKIAIVLSLILLIFSGLSHWKYINSPTLLFLLFIYCIIVTVLFTFNFKIIQFYSFEIISILIMYKAGYLASSFKIDLTRIILISCIGVASLGILKLLENPTSVFRRLALSGGYNYSASNYALASFLLFIRYQQDKQKKFLFFFILCTVLTIAQGSRQAILGLAIVIFLSLYKRSKSILITSLIISIPVLIISYFYLLQFEELTLLQRFSIDHLTTSSDNRFTLWYKSFFEKEKLTDIIIGTPEFNSLLISDTESINYYNPHNLIASTFRYHGIITTIILLIIVGQIFLSKRLALNEKLIFFIPLWYLLFSGELTRSFNFIFILGYCHDKIYHNLRSL